MVSTKVQITTFLRPLIQLIVTQLLLVSSTASLGMGMGYVPDGAMEYRPLVAASDFHEGGSRRVLEPFQLCSHCRCCAADDRSNCSSMSCCFRISCNLPDKPYGVCAFVPKICDCVSCT